MGKVKTRSKKKPKKMEDVGEQLERLKVKEHDDTDDGDGPMNLHKLFEPWVSKRKV